MARGEFSPSTFLLFLALNRLTLGSIQECDILRKLYPNLPVPVGNPGVFPAGPILDNSHSKKVLGMEYIPIEAMLKDSGDALIKLAEKEGIKLGA